MTTMHRPTSQSRAARRCAALPAVPATAALVLLAAGCAAPGAAPSPASVGPMIRADVAYLASDALEGRGTGTPGNDSAAAYIARRYAALGLADPFPGGQRPYLQPFVALSAADAHAGRTEGRPTNNVVAVARGTDPALRGQVVVIGAHFDHLGRSSESALDPQAGDAIRNGADDNASGTAALLELARRFAERPARRTVAFVAFSAEELGLLGAEHFVKEMPFAVDSVQAMLNFDMVGRLRDDRLIVLGTGTAAEMPALLAAANAGADSLRLSLVPDGYGRSDHSAFYGRGIPVLHFFTDLHDDYHRATDDAEKIDHEGIERVVALAERVARDAADRPARLQVIHTAPPAPVASSGSGNAVYFGSVPDMGASDTPGLRLTGVTPGSPADRAGVKPGDVVVEFGGTKVTDLYTYTDALRSHAPGDVVKVVVLRDGQRLEMEVTLGKRGG
ncbi:MAG TPA: M20/M25/M40 family metallo-hydrolase [Gemmatimonadales bacterium]